MSAVATMDASVDRGGTPAAWRRSARAATVAAVAVGALWVASPLTVLCGAATLAMCAWAMSDLEGRERLWVARILAATIGLRFLFVAGLVVATRPAYEPFLTPFPDGAYLIDRSLWIRNIWLGVPIGPHQALQVVERYGASSYPVLLAAIQYLVGPSPYGLALFSTASYVAGVLLWYRIVRNRFGAAVSTAGLALLLAWPSLFMWSVAVLKESFQFFLTAVVAASLYYVVRRARWSSRAAWACALVGAVVVLSSLRSGAAEIAVTGGVLAIVFRAIARRPWLAVAAVAAACIAGILEQDRLLATIQLAANRHVGYWGSPGRSYQLLDITFYANPHVAETMTWIECAQFLVRAAAAFVVVPAPWSAGSLSELVLAPQQIAWYLSVLAAGAGMIVGMRRDPWLTCILAGAALGGLIVIAPNSGNIGTLVRHRDLIVPFVLWLSVIGAVPAIRAALAGLKGSAV
jgi:hypothetical protein